jgi:hypothetical protein
MKHAEQTIADLESRLKELDTEAQRIKTAINCLCEVMGRAPMYDEVVQNNKKSSRTRPDEYYGRPLATVITEVFEKRKAAELGAATLDEIYNELIAGGCKFTGKNDGIKKRGLAISMSKNPKFHHLLSNDTWGLTEWYPTARESREATQQPKSGNGVIAEDTTNDEETHQSEQ